MKQPEYDGTTTPRGEIARQVDNELAKHFYLVAFDDKPDAKLYPVKALVRLELPGEGEMTRVLLPSTSGSWRVRTAILIKQVDHKDIDYTEFTNLDWVIGVLEPCTIRILEDLKKVEIIKAKELLGKREEG